MKLILTDNTEFALSHINVMQTKQEQPETEGAAAPDTKRIDVVFADGVDFDAVAAVDHALFETVTIRNTEGDRTFEGYAFNSLSQHISDNSDRMTLVLTKQ